MSCSKLLLDQEYDVQYHFEVKTGGIRRLRTRSEEEISAKGKRKLFKDVARKVVSGKMPASDLTFAVQVDQDLPGPLPRDQETRDRLEAFGSIPIDANPLLTRSIDTLFTRSAKEPWGDAFEGWTLDYGVKLIEAIAVFVCNIKKATSRSDYALALISFVHATGERSFSSTVIELLDSMFDSLFNEYDVQGPEEMFSSIRSVLDNYEAARDSKLAKKLYKFHMYALSLALYPRLGLDITLDSFENLHAEAIKKKYGMGHDFVFTLADTLLFLCERGYQCAKTGSIEPLFHSGTQYGEWVEKAREAKRLSDFLSNSDAHGIDLFDYFDNLNDLIEKGRAMSKHASHSKQDEAKLVKYLLNDLELIKASEVSKRSAQESRKAPFAILVHGGSSVGKSGFVELNYKFYGKLFGLRTEPRFKYTRYAVDKYWVNFNTSQWCIHLDDIAFIRAGALATGDPTLMEMLQVVNNVAFTPLQADLADKGKTPVKSRFVIATTNTYHLNLDKYFSCPLAVARRMPYMVDVRPKQEYGRDGGFLNSEALPKPTDGEFPNFWDIVVYRVVPLQPDAKRKGENDVMGSDSRTFAKAKYVKVGEYSDINAYLKWFAEVAIQHEKTQTAAMESNKFMDAIKVCRKCYCVKSLCPDYDTHLAEVLAKEAAMKVQGDDDVQMIDPLQWSSPENVRRLMENYREDLAKQTVFGWSPIGLGLFLLVLNWIMCNVSLTFLLTLILQSCFLYAMFLEWKVLMLSNRMSAKLYDSDPWMCLCLSFWTTLYKLSRYPVAGTVIRFLFGKNWLLNVCVYYSTTPLLWRIAFEHLGNKIQHRFGHAKLLAKIVGGISLLYVGGKLVSKTLAVCGYGVHPEEAVQGANISKPVVKSEDIGQKIPPTGDEKESVWIKSAYKTTTFDVSSATTSTPFDLAMEKLARASITLSLTFVDNGQKKLRHIKGACVSGQIYMFASHTIPNCSEPMEGLIIREPIDEGVTRNRKVLISSVMIHRTDNDLAFVKLPLEPGKNIVSLFCKPSLRGRHKAHYITRDVSGNVKTEIVHAIEMTEKFHEPNVLDKVLNIWFGHSKETTYGDCGMLCLSDSALGPVVLGMHLLGKQETVGINQVTCDMVQEGIDSFDVMQVQGSSPVISAPSAPRVLGHLHEKSPIRYIEVGTASVYGSFKGFRSRKKSAVRKSLLFQHLVDAGYDFSHWKPDLVTWRPKNIALREMVQVGGKLNQDILDTVKRNFLDDILAGLSEDDLKEVVVLDDESAINGIPGVAYVDRIESSTSAGCPWKKPKKQFLELLEPNEVYSTRFKMSAEIKERVDEIIRRYLNSERYHPIFSMNMKDEALKWSKIAAGKTRLFAGAPMDWTIVVRKVYLSVARLMQKNRLLFEHGIGVNVYSPEWTLFRDHLTKFGLDRIIAGDYAAFDKAMCAEIMEAAFWILIEIMKKAGYSESSILLALGVAVDSCYPLYDFFGDLIGLEGTMPSGSPLTVIINSLVNCLYMRYCFAVLNPEGKHAKNFKELVHLIVYGDDNIMGVSKGAEWFNHTAIQEVLAGIGVTYTMADKEAASVPFIHIDAATFLQRKWVWVEDLQAYAPQLALSSINKMLTVEVASASITHEDQSVDAVGSALMEYFFYGREVFEERSALLRGIVEKAGLMAYVKKMTFPTFDYLLSRFKEG